MPEEQLAKRGTYSGSYGWSLSSTVHQLEEGHVFSQDVFKGTFFNDAGEGFLHRSSCIAPAVSELTDGKGTAHGVAVFTDKDDDKAFITWKGMSLQSAHGILRVVKALFPVTMFALFQVLALVILRRHL